MPRSRRRLNSAAASAEPVEPPDTSASAWPAATARAAWTIDASGVVRTANAGSAALAIDTRALVARGLALVGRADQPHPDAAASGLRCARCDLVGPQIRAPRVDGYRDHRLRPSEGLLAVVRPDHLPSPVVPAFGAHSVG